MQRLTSFIACLMFTCIGLAAQPVDRSRQGVAGGEITSSEPIDVTMRLLAAPEALQAARTLQQLKLEGWSPSVSKRNEVPLLGEQRLFKVRDFAAEDSLPNPVFRETPCTLVHIHEKFLLWVETGELENAHAREPDLEMLRAVLADWTPEGSVNPQAGIIVNTERIFGAPPDVDQNGTADIVITDIRDGWQPGRNFIAGFVDPLDVLCLEPARQLCTAANMRDVLYLDTQPGLIIDTVYTGTMLIEGVTAHEYQHLIHLAYDPDEITFVNEGLSEWAQVLNGYESRPMLYLLNRDHYNVPLFRWTYGLSDAVLDDYQRAGLFTHYLADRFGINAVGSITRTSEARGADAYGAVLATIDTSLSLEDVVTDFHTANLLNDPNVTSPTGLLGYTSPIRREIHAQPSTRLPHTADFQTFPISDTIAAGGVLYLEWSDIDHFNLNFDVTAASHEQMEKLRSMVQVRVVLHEQNRITVKDFLPPLEREHFKGSYSRITVIVSGTRPDEAVSIPFTYSASWSQLDWMRQEFIVYDNGAVPALPDGSTDISVPVLYTLGHGMAQVNRFEIPANTTLQSVSVAPYYESDYGPNTDPQAPRNFRLHVWADDGTGIPGEELFSTDIEDRRSNIGSTLIFDQINLSSETEHLSNLSGTVYIGLSDSGDDQNYLMLAASPHSGKNPSLLQQPGTGIWTPLDEYLIDGKALLHNSVIPIRATFLVPFTRVAIENESDSPSRFELDQNYPNPFNPRTTLSYTVSEHVHVQLTVYDLLGRQVAMLVNETQNPGRYQIDLQAENWNSGTYFYTLRAGREQRTRAMTILR